MSKKIRLGLFGLGVVGSGLVSIVQRRDRVLKKAFGVELEIAKAVVRDTRKSRDADISNIAVSSDHEDILGDDGIDIVVELIGGIEPAYTLVRKALQAGKPVVSANKALIAEKGPELLALAKNNNTAFFAEASVGGGIPILKTMRESLIANKIDALTAIINGTTNFILTKMEEDGLSYFEALKLAGELGFAETDPTMDVEGIDAKQKLAILAAHMSGGIFPEDEILCEGISQLSERDFSFATRQKMAIKLLAIARRHEGVMELRVHPTLIPKLHPMASVRNEFNAIYLTGDAVGEVMLSGRGAGSLPTASAVYADIVDLATRTQAVDDIEQRNSERKIRMLPAEDTQSEYYLRFTILDKPGVIGEITTLLGKHDISVSSVSAKLVPNADELGEVEIVVHKSVEKNVLAAISQINGLDRVRGEGRFIRIDREL